VEKEAGVGSPKNRHDAASLLLNKSCHAGRLPREVWRSLAAAARLPGPGLSEAGGRRPPP
jgi:hypothetical protein